MNIHKLIACSLWLIIMAGCGKKPTYMPKHLTPLTDDNAQYEKTVDDVTVRVSKLDKNDSLDLFGRQGKNLFFGNKRICPLQLTIINHSDHTWILDRHNIDLAIMPKREVTERLLVTDTNRAILYSALGMGSSLLLFGAGLGCMLAGKLAIEYATKPIFYTGVALTSVAAFPSALSESHNKHHSQAVYDANSLIYQDIERKILPFTCTLHTNVMLNALFFIKEKDFKKNFTITLLDQSDESKTLTFDVTMNDH